MSFTRTLKSLNWESLLPNWMILVSTGTFFLSFFPFLFAFVLKIFSAPYSSRLTSSFPNFPPAKENVRSSQQQQQQQHCAADAISAQDAELFNSTLQRPLHASSNSNSGADAWQKVVSSLLQLFNFLLLFFCNLPFFPHFATTSWCVLSYQEKVRITRVFFGDENVTKSRN